MQKISSNANSWQLYTYTFGDSLHGAFASKLISCNDLNVLEEIFLEECKELNKRTEEPEKQGTEKIEIK